MLICKNDKIAVPTILRKCVVSWYHTDLLHPGTKRTEATISQQYYWPNLRYNTHTHIKVCINCQKKQETKPEVWKITR